MDIKRVGIELQNYNFMDSIDESSMRYIHITRGSLNLRTWKMFKLEFQRVMLPFKRTRIVPTNNLCQFVGCCRSNAP